MKDSTLFKCDDLKPMLRQRHLGSSKQVVRTGGGGNVYALESRFARGVCEA